ncbi:unnamed protein product [Paramecium pentaurelia]|uniref:Uncharacterized protein n=1 Tax=Paramecium pentaurelia TaxID=43138 RepID=A0A8S1T0A3_9CILI|nr:unnamed protein product [Paramecium pentaurelia]
MIFWIDNTSIYDCRTYSLIKPQQYDVAIILDYIKMEQQQNRIDIKEKLPKLLKTLALLLIIHNKNDIFRLLQILASKDFNYTKIFNDFMNNPAASWYIDQMKVEPVQMIMHQYIQGEYKFLEGLFQKIITSYEQYLQKLKSGQGTSELNQLADLQSNQNQISSNKKKSKLQKNQKQENQINKIQVSQVQIEKPNNLIKTSADEIKSNQDYKIQNQSTNTEQSQKQNTEVIQQQQQINKEKKLITQIEIEDKLQFQEDQNEQHKQQSVQQQLSQNQQVILNQKYQSNQENPKGSYFSEQQKISLESVFKDDLPDQKMFEIVKISSDKSMQKQTQLHDKQLEKLTEKSEKIINTEQKVTINSNNVPEPDKFNQFIDILNDKEQQEFEFSEDTELIKLYDLLKEKCQQIECWSNFQDRCLKAMSDKELEMIMFEKLPILMKRWAIITKKNVTEMEIKLNQMPIQETKSILIDNINSQELIKEIHIAQQKLENFQKADEQSLNQNQKNEIKNLYENQQIQIQKQQNYSDFINKENNSIISKLDENKFINQNQLLYNEIQEVIPCEIINIDDEIFKSQQGESKKGQLSKVIKTASNRLNSETSKQKQQQNENVDKQIKQLESQLQSHSEKQSNIICIESSNDENISNKKMQQPTIQQQQADDCIIIQKQNIVCPNIQSGINQINDDIDNLFEDNNDIFSPDSIVSSQSILISDQSSIKFNENQTNKKQFDSKEQLNQQSNKDILKVQEKNIKEQRDEEYKSKEKKYSESDIDIKEKQKHKNKKRQHSKQNSENKKTKSRRKESKNDKKEKTRAKSSQQYKEKEKSKDIKKRKSSEKKSDKDIFKTIQAEKEAKERQKEEQKKKEKEKIHQENIKKAEQRLQRMRSDEIEYQKEYNYLEQQSKLKEMKEREQKQQQQYHNKKYQQINQQSQQNYKNGNLIQEQNQKLKSLERQIQDQQYENIESKLKNNNQQNLQKMQEGQPYGYRSQQINQGHEKSMVYQNEQNNQWDSQRNQKSHQKNYNQNDRHQRTQNQNNQEQINVQQNQQQRQNSYAFPLEQYGIQEFLTKKDQTFQKNIQKQIINPVQYDLEQVQSPYQKQRNFRKYQQQQQYPQQQQQQQFQQQQQQQSFQQQQYQFSQQQQFFNNQKPSDKKFRNNQSPQQGYYMQKQHYQNQQEPHIKKQRKYNPYHEQFANNQNFNQNSRPPSNMNDQLYSYQDEMNNRQSPYKNPSSFCNSPINSSNQPSKQQMFEFFCQMFYDKFQQTE